MIAPDDLRALGKRLSELSGGAFDGTVQPLWELYVALLQPFRTIPWVRPYIGSMRRGVGSTIARSRSTALGFACCGLGWP